MVWQVQLTAIFSLIGVKKWSKKCDDELKHQETISVKAWVKAMDSRITSLGGEGVQRFLGNLFRAFDGLFESSSLPSKAARKAVTVMQGVRQIKAVSCYVTKDAVGSYGTAILPSIFVPKITTIPKIFEKYKRRSSCGQTLLWTSHP